MRFYHSYVDKGINNVNTDNIQEYNKVRYSNKNKPSSVDVIVIGSGIGGLTTASLLAKTGKKVLVLEQHYIAGGTTHSFEMSGIEHETGLHYIGNVKKRIPILDLITSDTIEWCQLGYENKDNKLIYDEIYIGDKKYQFETGENNLKKYLINLFPKEKEGIHNYFDLIKKVSNKDVFFKFKVLPYMNVFINYIINNYIYYFHYDYYKYTTQSALKIVTSLIKNEELISVLFGQFGDYGQLPEEVSFFIHASIVNHYLEGGWFPKGGTNVIGDSISKSIYQNGGQVLVAKKVNRILIKNNKVYGVEMDNSDIIYSDVVVSSIGFRNTFSKLVSAPIPKIYKTILYSSKPSVQHMYCFVKLEGTPEELGLTSANLWIYPHSNYKKLMEDFIDDPIIAPIPLFMVFSCMKDTKWNSKYKGFSNALILTTVSKEWFNEWEEQKCTNRGSEYEAFKRDIGERMLNEGLFKYFPQTEDKVLEYNMASPLSTQYYLNSMDGESYGMLFNESKFKFNNYLRPKTSIEGLYLTGQDICTLGVTGAMMAGVLTANVIAGYDNIIDLMLSNNIIVDLKNVESFSKKNE